MRIANALLNSLKGGVVPRTGLGYITVGRKDEIDALLNDIEMISEGGASFRFVVGKYGAGKSFLLQTIRNYAMERGFVVVDADLSPERRLVGNKGDGLATYKELMKNLSTQTSPDGGALSLLLSKWIIALKTLGFLDDTALTGYSGWYDPPLAPWYGNLSAYAFMQVPGGYNIPSFAATANEYDIGSVIRLKCFVTGITVIEFPKQAVDYPARAFIRY